MILAITLPRPHQSQRVAPVHVAHAWPESVNTLHVVSILAAPGSIAVALYLDGGAVARLRYDVVLYRDRASGHVLSTLLSRSAGGGLCFGVLQLVDPIP